MIHTLTLLQLIYIRRISDIFIDLNILLNSLVARENTIYIVYKIISGNKLI